jgi:hypothetical protein
VSARKQVPHEKRAARLPAQGDQPAHHEAGHRRREREAPGRPSERLAHDDRSEHPLRAAEEQVVEQGLSDQEPEPGVAQHLGETVAHLAEHAAAHRRRDVRDVDAREARRRERERGRVDRERPAAAAAEVQHGARQGDRRDAVAEMVDGRAGEEPAVRPVAERVVRA